MITQVELSIDSGSIVVDLHDPVSTEDEALEQAVIILEDELSRAKVRQTS